MLLSCSLDTASLLRKSFNMFFTVVGLILLSFLSTGVSQPGPSTEMYTCPVGYTLHEENCYAYMQDKQTWQEAEIICSAIHAHLVEIYTPEEMTFVLNFTLANGGHHGDVWLGGHDLVLEGRWSWAWSGAPLTYTNWRQGEPNDDHGTENCMELHHADGWNDQQCDEHNHYICQRRLQFSFQEFSASC